MVGVVWHFAPSAAPPPGQKTDTGVSFAPQLTVPSLHGTNVGACVALSALPPCRQAFPVGLGDRRTGWPLG